MRSPNSMMKNLIGGVFSRDNSASYVRAFLFSGGELTESEKVLLNTDVAGAYLYTWSSIVYELNRTRQQACMLSSSDCIRAMGAGKFSLSFSETKFVSAGVAGVECGLMLIFIGPNSSQYTTAIALTVGEVGSGADVEMSSTLSTVNMVPAFGDLIINFA